MAEVDPLGLKTLRLAGWPFMLCKEVHAGMHGGMKLLETVAIAEVLRLHLALAAKRVAAAHLAPSCFQATVDQLEISTQTKVMKWNVLIRGNRKSAHITPYIAAKHMLCVN